MKVAVAPMSCVVEEVQEVPVRGQDRADRVKIPCTKHLLNPVEIQFAWGACVVCWA